MTTRRRFLAHTAGFAAATSLAGAIERAAAVEPDRRSGTLHDVRHVVVLTQENRSFDHYFGALDGVRGFADPFVLPTADARTVWLQPRAEGGGLLAPFRLDTGADFALARIEGTPHTWPDALAAWDHGRLAAWPRSKGNHALAHYAPEDLPFHTALADAFTLCDAYHCSFFGGTHPNRYFLTTGTHDPYGVGGGPALYNDVEDFGPAAVRDGYRWTTYAERLEDAGVSWQVYQVLGDNFDDNAFASFIPFRDAYHRRPGHRPELRERAGSTRGLNRLREDVLADRLPQVSWIVGPAEGSEHPWLSGPAQGAAYIAAVLEALAARPEVWARTVLFVNYDENDGYFDHAPSPAVPSRLPGGTAFAGRSNVDTAGEYHLRLVDRRRTEAEAALLGQPYGLGPRVPMFVVSPFSRGGWVCSEVFDHTSVIRFLEARFGVREPHISAWRRAVCGDLTSAFDFRRFDPAPPTARLPDTGADAARARALPGRRMPVPPPEPSAPVQRAGARPARALAQAIAARCEPSRDGLRLRLVNDGALGVVVHLVDRLQPQAVPRRYTVAAGTTLDDTLAVDAAQAYDLWLLGPNGWHRHWIGRGAADEPQASAAADRAGRTLTWIVANPGPDTLELTWQDLAYGEPPRRWTLRAGASGRFTLALPAHRWYDGVLRSAAHPQWLHRAAGHAENGRPSISDPAMHGPALLQAWRGGPRRDA